MKASVKCSACNAEITNLNFSWGKKHWLFMLPIMLIAFLPMWKLYAPRGDYREDLQIIVLEKRIVDNYLEILGTIENTGDTTWERVELEAEFYDTDGKFIDEESGSVSGDIVPGQKEQFKIKFYDANEALTGNDVEMKLKVADASFELF